MTDVSTLQSVRNVLATRSGDFAAYPGSPLANLSLALTQIGLQPLPDIGPAAPPTVSFDGLAPMFRNLPPGGLSALRDRLASGSEKERVAAWAEKLLRWFEIRRTEAWSLACRKWPARHDAAVNMLELCSFYLEYYVSSRDVRFLNVALKCGQLPLPGRRRWPQLAHAAGACAELGAWHFRTAVLRQAALRTAAEGSRSTRPPAPADARLAVANLALDPALFAGRPTPRVCILSPNPYSLFTLATTELLCRAGVSVRSLFVRRLLNWKRAALEFRRDGTRLLDKIRRKLLFRRSGYAQGPFEAMPEFFARYSIHYANVDALAKARGFPVYRCWDLNDADVVARLREDPVDLIVFTGGGLIREAVLANAGQGVLSIHPGVLPLFRGMDVPDWAILDGYSDWVGSTVHFMAAGVDTGPYLARYRIDYADCSSRAALLQKIEPLMTCCLVSTCLDFLQGKLTPKPQLEEDGKQFFYMHPLLYALVEQRLQESSSASVH